LGSRFWVLGAGFGSGFGVPGAPSTRNPEPRVKSVCSPAVQ
jgi:hypothetical protein